MASRFFLDDSERNHAILIPVLARTMRALKANDGRHSNHATKSEEFFVSKKSFASSNNKLFGREPQLKQLEQLFDQLSQSSNENASYLALVHGKSGCGKSSLVEAFVKTLSLMKTSVLFSVGKFDQVKAHSPYVTLIKAANDLAKKALRSSHAESIKTRLLDELDSDIYLLANIVEELSVLLPNQEEAEETKGTGLTGKAITRFQLLMRSFIRSIATQETPVVLFFDDLQWADDATFEILKALLTDKLSSHVMLVLAYRDDEMDAEKLQKNFSISSLDLDDEDKKQPTSYRTNIVHRTEIEVPNLDLHALNQMVSTVLTESERKTASLTDIIMNKTQGNPFYALNFMDILCANGMLQQDDSNSWQWNESIIRQQMDVSDNLAHILEIKILRLPEKVRSILQLAAFIGHEFTSNILTTIVHEEQDMIEGEYSFDLFNKEVIRQWIVDALNLALEEGLVELAAATNGDYEETYKFSHDRIQHCLYKDLMPDDVERRLLHQRIGKLIWNTISSKDNSKVDDWVLFLAVDNLNCGPKFVDDDGDRVEMVELNIRAGKLAASKAAFVVSAEYLRCGEKLIADDNFVKSNYDLCMDLWCTSAEMERIAGEFERSDEIAKKIHKYARETEDHFPAHLIEIKNLAIQGEPTNAMALAFKVLRQMGVKFPKKISILTVAQEFVRAKLMIGRRTPEELVKLPVLTDRKKLFALELLSSVNSYAFIAGDSAKFTFVAVSLRMATLTLQYGLSDLYAPQAFIGYGTVCCFFGNFELGLSFGDAAQRLLRQQNTQQSIKPRTELQYFNFIRPWTYGLNEALGNSFLQLYQNSMLVGDVDFAYTACLMWLFCGFNVAVSLDELVTRGTKFRLEMEEYGEKSILLIMVPTLQAMRIMRGDRLNQNPAILTGEDMDLEEFSSNVDETKENTAFCSLILGEINLAMHFGDWEGVHVKMPILERNATNLEGHFCYPIVLTTVIWSSYRLYDMTGKKRHRQIGRRFHRQVKQYDKLKSPLAMTARKMLAAAEAAFVEKKPLEECEDLFVSALQHLEKERNYRMNSFLADELADLFLREKKIEKGTKYLQESLESSVRWGAGEKVRFLENKLSVLHEMRSK